LIYVSKTLKAITAQAEVNKVEKLPLDSLWRVARETAGVSRQEFDRYFHDLEVGYAITIGRVKKLPLPISLAKLRSRFGLDPPQSFRFAPNSLVRACEASCALPIKGPKGGL
jgi:predicted transcriptional regulator